MSSNLLESSFLLVGRTHVTKSMDSTCRDWSKLPGAMMGSPVWLLLPLLSRPGGHGVGGKESIEELQTSRNKTINPVA
jgi:hypothetical protein